MKRLTVLLMVMVISVVNAYSQCAMCRTTIENNYSNGEPGIAAGINVGILYLLSMPYLAIIVISYLWFKSSKSASKKLSDGIASR